MDNNEKCPKCGLLLKSNLFKTCECKEEIKEAIFLNNHVVPAGTKVVVKG